MNIKKFNGLITSKKTQDYLNKILGEKKDTFITTLTSLVSNNEKLQACEPITVMYSALKATALSLPLDNNLGFAYVIPYGNQAQFQIGYKGFVQLALRTNKYKRINVTDVRAGEIVSHDRMTGELVFNWLDDTERAGVPVIGYMAYIQLLSGFEKSFFLTTKQLTNHAMKFSKSFQKGYGLWKDDLEAMASKTVLKLLLSKYGILSIELGEAIKYDQSVIVEENTQKYIDNEIEIIDVEENAREEEKTRIQMFINKANKIKDLENIKLGLPIEHIDFFTPIIGNKIKTLKK